MLKKNPSVYSCNVYLVRGDWNKMDDINTLIDVGTDGFIIDELNDISTGVGKKRVEQVIITHDHFDHSAGLSSIITEYNPIVYGFSEYGRKSVKVKDGSFIKTGDKYSMIIYTPGHSNDSICIYNEEEQVLFSGDTTISVHTTEGSYSRDYVNALERLTKLKIKTIYPGHNEPIIYNAKEILNITLKNILRSKIID